MRPVELRLQAFGPYRESTTVTFERLAQGGLFVIAGETGAGKTTLLDGICYALFGEASGSDRRGSHLRSQFAPGDLRTEAELRFRVGTKEYTILRVPSQSLTGPRGGKRDEQALTRLEQLEPGGHWRLLTDQDREASQSIESLIGLKREQFRGVVVLPQGQFSSFLRARSDDRERLLSQIFDISAAQALTDRLKIERDKLEGELSRTRHHHELVLQSTGAETLAQLRDRLHKLSQEENLYIAERPELLRVAQSVRETALAVRQRLNVVSELSSVETQLAQKVSELDQAEKLSVASETEYQSWLSLRPSIDALKEKRESLRIEFRDTQRALSLRTDIERAAAELLLSQNKLKALESDIDSRRAEQEAAQAGLDQLRLRLETTAVPQFGRGTEELARRETLLQSQIKDFQRAESLGREAESALAKIRPELERLRVRQAELQNVASRNLAATLAETLQSDQPCPVCGSTTHPNPTSRSASDMSATDIKVIAERVRALEREETAAATKLSEATQALFGLNSDLAKLMSELVQTQIELKTQRDRQLAEEKAHQELLKSVRLAEGQCKGVNAKLESVLSEARQVAAVVERNRLTQAEHQARLQGIQDSWGKLRELATIESEGKETNARVEADQLLGTTLQRAFSEAQSQLVQTRAHVTSLESRGRELQKQLAQFPAASTISLEQANSAAEQAELTLSQSDQVASVRRERLAQDQKQVAQLEGLEATAQALESQYGQIARLAGLLLGEARLNSGRVPFARYLLQRSFDRLLEKASARLAVLSRNRYRLIRPEEIRDKRSQSGLDVVIADAWTQQQRDLATVSGGETFWASLALALGLSDLLLEDQGGVHLESLFIDEGFGTLDGDALEDALRVLHDLQAGGRVVGLISHISLLKDEIPTRLEVTRNPDGTSTAAWAL